MAFGDVLVDEFGQLELPGQLEGGGEEAEVVDPGLEGLAAGLLEFAQEAVGGAEVGEDHLAWLAVEALAGDDLPVAATANGFGDEGGHELVNTRGGHGRKGAAEGRGK